MPQPGPNQPEANTYPIRVLVAEDDPAVARLMMRSLERLGYPAVGPVAGGMQACELGLAEQVQAAMFDIALSDQVTGIEAAAVLHEQLDTAIVFVTGQADPALVLTAAARCACGYLVKPVDDASLAQTLSAELELAAWRRAERERLGRPATEDELQAMVDNDDADVFHPLSRDAFETAQHFVEQALYRSAVDGLGLPRQQARVAAAMALGLTRAEIAKKIDRSPHTVDSYLKLIYQRTRLRDRRSLALAVISGATNLGSTDGAGAPGPAESASAHTAHHCG